MNIDDRMKFYENYETDRRLIKKLPVIVRLDGRGFHNFTKGLQRPYDTALSSLMIKTTQYLAQETNAVCGYTQSDEITLAYYAPEFDSEIFFDGRIFKMTSILAAMCSVYFNKNLYLLPESHSGKMPLFDCRVWNVPDIEEGANAFLSRELDATKNSITMAASYYYSHAQLMGKNSSEKQEMLHQRGVNWNNYPSFFKRGTYIVKQKISKPFTTEELDKLPEKHEARRNPHLTVIRSEYNVLDMPSLMSIQNRGEVLFLGKEPIIGE